MTKTKLVLMNGFDIMYKSMMLCNLKGIKFKIEFSFYKLIFLISIHLHKIQLLLYVLFTGCDKSDYILTISGKKENKKK